MRLTQIYQRDRDVLTAARERVSFIFDHYDDIKGSISGGKDSTVLAHLLLAEANRRSRKIGLFLLDEEVMYQSSVDQCEYLMFDVFPDNVIPLWLQIPFKLTNATSYSEGQLIAWEPGKHDIWMRPKKSFAIKAPMWDIETQTIADKNKGFGFYDVIDNFEACYHNAAFMVGLRGIESPNRWRAVSKNPVTIGDKRIYWATKKGNNISAYPLFDWTQADIWRYIYDNKLRYSKIYDYYFRKGTPLNEQRVSSLIHEKSFKSIVELPEFEPKTYNKLVKRIAGISLAQETGKSAKLFRARKLPKNYKSWRQYRDFLVATYPDDSKKWIFEKRFAKHLDNEFVARQQVRQLILNDYENNLPVDNKPDPRDEWLAYYRDNL